jgi:hypothetical protein
MALKLILFTIAWLIGIYLFHSLISRSLKKIVISRLLVYVTTVGMLGLYGEIFVDSLYKYLFGSPLWRYDILPIHHAYTSAYAAVLWGAYGFYLYLLHDNLKNVSITKEHHLALIFSLEALVIEALVELTSKLAFGKYIYWYYPNGLWHISAFQNFPFYVICGFLIVKTLRRFLADPKFFVFLNSWLILMVVFVI